MYLNPCIEETEENLSAQVFARKHAGKRIRATLSGGGFEYYGRVVGYWAALNRVLMEPEDIRQIGRELNDELLNMYPAGTFQFMDDERPRYIAAFSVQFITLIKPSRMYPNACLECKQPAQLIFNMVDCSNSRCRHYRP